MRKQTCIRKSNKIFPFTNRSVLEIAATLDNRFDRNTLDYGDSGFDEGIALEVDDSIAKDNAIRLLDAIVSGNRMEILDAAMNMTTEDATRLRNQIRNQRATLAPMDKAVIDAANFAVEIIERKELLNRVHIDLDKETRIENSLP